MPVSGSPQTGGLQPLIGTDNFTFTNTPTPTPPVIQTSQNPAKAYVGESISDTANISGLRTPDSGDTVTFKLYDASDTLVYTDPTNEPVTVSGDTATATSAGYTAQATDTGTLYWVATFNPDSNDTLDSPVSSAATAEPVNIDTASPPVRQPEIAYSGRVDQRHGHGHRPGRVPAARDTVTFNLYSSFDGTTRCSIPTPRR